MIKRQHVIEKMIKNNIGFLWNQYRSKDNWKMKMIRESLCAKKKQKKKRKKWQQERFTVV